MSRITRPQLVIYAVAALAIVLVGVRHLQATRAPAPGPSADASPAAGVRVSEAGGRAGGAAMVVQVAGAVRRPGVYRLKAGQRVHDAVRMAGGALPQADLAGVNLAAKAEDGRQVIVPLAATAPGGAGTAGGSVPGGSVAGVAAAGGTGSAAGGAGAGPPLNLNTATAEQLDTLDGIGPATAAKILAYRQERGGFRSVAELGQVPGIGEKRMAALRERVTV